MTGVLVRKENFETESHKEKVAQEDGGRHHGSVLPNRKLQEAMEGAGSPASPENMSITTQGLQMPELWKQAGQTERLSAVHSYRLSLWFRG